MRDQLSIGRMVGRFDADDLRRQGVVVLLDEAEKVKLRLGRANEKNLAVTFEGAGDLAKVPVLVVGVIPDAQVELVGVTM
jgi:hypothetical protein